MSEPAYMRIAQAIRADIRSGRLAPHESIPPERELCHEYGVSRMTARRALTLLEDEGLVRRDGSKGTFVSEPRFALRVGSFSSEVEKLGYVPSASVIWSETQQATADVARGLQLEWGDPVIAIRRLRRVNGLPLAVETSYYPQALVPGLLEGDLSGSLWHEINEGYGISMAFTSARVEVITLPSEFSSHLAVRLGSHGMQLTRTSKDSAGKCVEYAVDIYRSDRVSLIIDRDLQ